MRKLLPLIMLATPVFGQDDVRVGDDGSDARLRAMMEAAPLLPLERVDIELSPRLEIAEVSGITSDREGNLYIFQRGRAADPIIVTDPAGNVLRTFGGGLYERPHSIRIDGEGNVWTVDSTTSMVYKHSPEGELLLEIGVGDVPDIENASRAASDIAFGAGGRVYISDGYGNARVVVHDANGARIAEWGRPGTGPGEFDLPHSIATGPDGNVYVADRENGRVQWFTPEGRYLGEWTFGGRVLGVAFSAEGGLYISAEPKGAPPQQEAAVLHVDRRNGRVLGKIADFGHEIAVGRDGTLLPASLGKRITVYRPSATSARR